MFWLFNDDDKYTIKQIFNNTIDNIVNDNTIIDLTRSIYNTQKDLLYNDKIVICIKDGNILYKTKTGNYCFKFKQTVMIRRPNTLELIYEYTKQNENVMPILLEQDYDYYYINEYKIYKSNKNDLIVEELNTKTNITRKYLLERIN